MEKLIQMIDDAIKTKNKVIIGIDGPCASGKSTLGLILEEKYSALLIHMDDYFLAESRKTKERLAQSGGNVDYERVKAEIFTKLNCDFITSNRYNCNTKKLEQASPKKNSKVIIVEGSYSLHPLFFDQYTLRVFVDIEASLQSDRIQKRNGEKLFKRFVEEWIPLENYYFKSEDLKHRVDYILNLNS